MNDQLRYAAVHVSEAANKLHLAAGGGIPGSGPTEIDCVQIMLAELQKASALLAEYSEDQVQEATQRLAASEARLQVAL